MQSLLMDLRLLAMVAWVGGMVFFAFVVAPVAFHSLSSAHEAGLVVGGSLRVLHWIGLVGGGVFYAATALLWLRAEVPARVSFAIQLALWGIMLAGEAYSHVRFLPGFEQDGVVAWAAWRGSSVAYGSADHC